MITEDYVDYEIARLLENKGFDELCYACYEYFKSSVTLYHGWSFEYKGHPVKNSSDRIKCPTLQMAMKWLREKHNIFIGLRYDEVEDEQEKLYYTWFYDILLMKPYRILEESEQSYNSYKETVEAAIKYCLENLV